MSSGGIIGVIIGLLGAMIGIVFWDGTLPGYDKRYCFDTHTWVEYKNECSAVQGPAHDSAVQDGTHDSTIQKTAHDSTEKDTANTIVQDTADDNTASSQKTP